VLLCGTVAVAAWCAAGLGGLEWSGIENAATSIWNGGAPRAATTPGADAGAESTSSKLALASAAMRATDTVTVDPAPHEAGSGGLSAAEAPIVKAPLPDSRPAPPSETRGRLVSLFRPDLPAEEDPQPAARPVETLDECLVVDICIDEYLWSLYERTPKVDTNKLTERIKTTVKTKGKTRTVTKTITKYVVANFAYFLS